MAIAADGTRYIVWQDTRGGAEQIMMTRSDVSVRAVPFISRSTFSMGGIRPEPVPAGGRATLDLSLPVDGTVQIVVFDMEGAVASVPFTGFVTQGGTADIGRRLRSDPRSLHRIGRVRGR